VAIATLHRYPLQLCFDTPSQPIYPTVAHLLAPTATRSLADSVSAAAETAHAHHVSLRIDEMNSVSCGQHYVPGVTHTFASALWALDALFEMARVGVDGVNIHSYPDATYSPFAISRVCGQWRARVAPDYYGLEMFADAAPAGSRLLKISQRGAAHTDVWAVDAPDGTIHVVVINEDSRARNVDVRIPRGRARARATGALERLQAPSLLARNGVTIAGQRFGPETGLLQGRRRTFAVKATPAGAYRFDVPAASAALLTLPSS
jgi:hypothetical protein